LFISEYEEAYKAYEGYKFYEEDILQGKVGDNTTSSDTKEVLSFEQIVSNMIDITPDGGVKKQTMIDGIGEVIPPDANVTSNLYFVNFRYYILNFLIYTLYDTSELYWLDDRKGIHPVRSPAPKILISSVLLLWHDSNLVAILVKIKISIL